MDINILGGLTSSSTQHSALPQTSTSPSPQSVTTSDSASKSSTPPTAEQIKQAVANINASLKANGNEQSVQFAIDPGSKQVVVQVIDPKTATVIRQIPSEEIIHMGMMLGQKLGQVIDQEA